MKIVYLFIIIILTLLNYKLFLRETFTDERLYNLDLIPKIFLFEAKKLGIKYEVKNHYPSMIKIFNKNKSVIITSLSYTFNKSTNVKLARNKFKTYNLLRKYNIPVPKFQLFQNVTNSTKNLILNKLTVKYPIVSKIVDGANGDLVFTNIYNNDEFLYSINKIISANYNEILVEKFLSGNDHRILLFNNKIIDVLCRIPPLIVGDGYKTIQQLVVNKNNHRRIMGHRRIIIDYYYLKKKNKTINYIPKYNETVTVNPLSNFHKGAELKRLDINKIHPDNIRLFEKVSKIMKLQILGLDFITDDIKISYKKQGKVNEVNGIPNLDLHYYADNKNSTEIHTKILKKYFNI